MRSDHMAGVGALTHTHRLYTLRQELWYVPRLLICNRRRQWDLVFKESLWTVYLQTWSWIRLSGGEKPRVTRKVRYLVIYKEPNYSQSSQTRRVSQADYVKLLQTLYRQFLYVRHFDNTLSRLHSREYNSLSVYNLSKLFRSFTKRERLWTSSSSCWSWWCILGTVAHLRGFWNNSEIFWWGRILCCFVVS